MAESLNSDDLRQFIEDLRILLNAKKISVPRPRILISALSQLADLIGLSELKSGIIELIRSFIVTKYILHAPGYKISHFCNYGNPGTGKTRVSKLIAKIYYGLGVMSVTETPVAPGDDKDNVEAKMEVASIVSLASDIDIKFSELSKLLLHEIAECRMAGTFGAAEGQNKVAPLVTSLIISIKSLTNITGTDESLVLKNENVDPDDPDVDESVYCVVCGRKDLVARYMGQTSDLTYEFLSSHKNKTIIIEEAYSLYTGEKDIFGIEAITELNRFMDENKECVIGFNGYKRQMEETLFWVQPGLKSRIGNFIYTRPYSAQELSDIFQTQLKDGNFRLDEDIDAVVIFSANAAYFSAYGRDTLRLANCVRTQYFSQHFKELLERPLLNGESPIFSVDAELLDKAVVSYINQSFNGSV